MGILSNFITIATFGLLGIHIGSKKSGKHKFYSDLIFICLGVLSLYIGIHTNLINIFGFKIKLNIMLSSIFIGLVIGRNLRLYRKVVA
ncbi:hypothetical protein ACFIJ5_18080 (plasmid) [Haloimpatiens sp. FM7330]|uniref:hypothetical protein n=1 Tax=Haloimpatiens sp. FM7330 TaxID=3298610 RepID=UPI00362CBD88